MGVGILQITPLLELQERLKRLQAGLQAGDLDAVFIMENTDLFYFAGSMQQGFFAVPAQGEPIYLVRRNYGRAREESAWTGILPMGGFQDLPAALAAHGYKGFKRVGLEWDVLPVNIYRRLRKLFPGMEFADASILLREIRMLKSAYELDCFRRAGAFALAVNRQIPALLQSGKAELFLSAEIENLHRRGGHQGVLRMRAFNAEMFFGHVYAGENGALHTFVDSCTGGSGVTTACPQGAGWKTLAPHEPIGVDYAAICEGYIVDHTRVFSIGSLPPELQRAYAAAVEIQDEIIKKALPGASCAELYCLAVAMAAEMGLEENFMGYGREQVKFIGHGIGLEIDELPVLGQASPFTLTEGMVIALEPKFIFPGKGMVGLENAWHVTTGGPEKLSPIPDDLVVVPL
ncbi:MAG TPA: aminopeptidase P family protein [Firmicutes bacterium]|nr:aminopeptidase P family protein [Bacillota bacterium]